MKNLSANFFLILTFLIFFGQNSLALTPEEHLSDAEEERAHNIFLQVRCPVCDGQVIESSDTEVAAGLRNLIRKQIAAGKSDLEIKSYLTKTYGADILNAPSINFNTFFLWFAPLFFFICGVLVIFLKAKSHNKLQTKKIHE
jgi:cytochrome c-type biogenesis protein CcmH